MVEILDDSGRVFGRVNVIDLFVVLIALAVFVAGVVLVAGGPAGTGDPVETEPVVLEVTADDVEPYVAEAVPAPGPIEGENVSRLRNVSVSPTQVVTTDSDGDVHLRDHPRLKRIDVTVEVAAVRRNGTVRYADRRIYPGRKITVDLDTVVFRGKVTTIGPPS